MLASKKTFRSSTNDNIFPYVLGSIAAVNVFKEKKSPNIIFWSSADVPAPCFTNLGRDHS